MKKLFGHISYANVASTLAIIVALSGVAYAANTAAKNSVVSKSIKNGEVKAKDIGSNAVGDDEVRDLSQDRQQPTLANGWVSDDAAFAKTNDGVVHLIGRLDGEDRTAGPAFTLPAGFRPVTQAQFQIPCESQGIGTAEMTVEAGGDLSVSFFDSGCGLPFTVDVTGVSFLAAEVP